MPTPEAAILAAHNHIAAQMSQDIHALKTCTGFPFVHIDTSGQLFTYPCAKKLASRGNRPFITKITHCEIIETIDNVAVLSVQFQRFDLNEKPTTKAKALWGAVIENDRWLIKWRQFLGEIQDT